MPRRDGQDDCKVFVGSLPFSCTEDQLYNHFSWFGGVTDTKVVVDKESGRSRGFGFVTFDSQATAQAAVAQMNNTAIDGRPVFLELARESNQGGPRDRQGPPPGSFPSSGPPDSKRKWRVSIRGIHPGANWRDVKDYLRGVGDIAYATEKKDGSGDW
uniref:Heterogeneous nuclear ribonucleoprotein G n=1 Tax=Tetraselmis sp. GSL018 TaxID=582737 RepID=A0A061RCW0_9CHLO